MSFTLFGAAMLMLSVAQELPNNVHARTTAAADARFQVVQSQIAVRWTFLVDTWDGTVWQLASEEEKIADGKTNQNAIWQRVGAPSDANRKAGTLNYQFFLSGVAARWMLLTNVHTGDTWQLVRFVDDGDKLGWTRVPKVQ
jgi:hypothetical protein